MADEETLKDPVLAGVFVQSKTQSISHSLALEGTVNWDNVAGPVPVLTWETENGMVVGGVCHRRLGAARSSRGGARRRLRRGRRSLRAVAATGRQHQPGGQESRHHRAGCPKKPCANMTMPHVPVPLAVRERMSSTPQIKDKRF